MAGRTRKTRVSVSLLPTDPCESAKLAGLRYVSDSTPGIRRKGSGKGWSYVKPDGTHVRDQEELLRIRSLVIPPAWTDVWICPSPYGHLQAVGLDARGRKQYRYHPLYRKVRDATKFTRMIAFGLVLPKIREQVAHDIKVPELPKKKVLAAIVQLLEQTCIRVGNEEYRKQNDSFGLTTMRDQHVDIAGAKIRFHFRGKSGQEHDIELKDRRLAKIVYECQAIPGQELFQYYGDDGECHKITSGDVNDYLREITGEDFTAKDFRTWAGTVMAMIALQEFEAFDSQAQAKKNIVRAIESVARRLGNRPSVCRKCYVHPGILDAYLEGTMLDSLRRRASEEMAHVRGLNPEESAVLALLQRRLAEEDREDRSARAASRGKAGARRVAPGRRPDQPARS